MKIVLEAVDGDVTRKIERDVRVDATTLPIELELATGSLRGSGEDSGARLRVSHDLPGGGRFMVLFRADESGNFEIAGLPAGSVELKRYEDGAHGLGWYRGTEVTVTAGGLTSME